jgi:ABC-2 type transport system ATP-binding protein
VRHGWCLLEVKRQHVIMEETFRKLTGGEAAKAGAPPQAA